MKKYGFGLIGCGNIAKKHFAAIKSLPGAKLVAVADINKTVLATTVVEQQCRGYDDYQELLADPTVDVVCICTGNGLHARIALDAIRACKHVLVEKPMAMSLSEADKMIAAAEAMNVKLGVVHPNRFLPAVVKLRQALDNNKFNKLTHAVAVVRWNRNDDYYKQASWRGTWAQDGGCLMNQAIHNVDLLQWMMGPVESVFAYTTTQLRDIEAEDLGVAVLRFASGALGVIEATTTIYPQNFEETLSVFGSDGLVRIGGANINGLQNWRFVGEEEAAVVAEYQRNLTLISPLAGHTVIIQDFIEAITLDREPAINGLEGRKALEIILAIYHSATFAEEIKLPLCEKFTIGMECKL